MRKALPTIVVALVVTFFSTYVALCCYPIPLPESWKRIRLRQPRNEVLALLPDLETDLFDMKGFDQTLHTSESALFGQVRQGILIRYDRDARVERLDVRTQTSRFPRFKDRITVISDA